MKEVYERLTAAAASAKSAHHRIDNMEQLVQSINTIAVEIRAMREDVNEIYERLSELEDRPRRRFDMILDKVIVSLAGVLLGILFGSSAL
ncbi:MAG: hypothetical protein PUF72_10010 [Clostridiales bacterium]|nr:hypothetical protein [Clostridiales bacterium]